jgi:hypothetical protein
LEGLGIEVTISRAELQLAENRSKANTSHLKIRKIPPAPPISPVSENHERNQSKITGGISINGSTIPPVNKIPPVQNIENHTQKSRVGNTLPFIFFLIIKRRYDRD